MIAAIFFSACEKNYDLTGVSTLPSKPVVEGYIENNLPPYVFLSNTFSVFGSLNKSSLKNLYIHDATVIVSDGSKVINLKEYGIPFGADTLYVYTVNGLDFSGYASGQVLFSGLGYVGITSAFNIADIGQTNTTYTLSITLKDGSKISAQTSILNPPSIDSLWTVPRNAYVNDSLVRVWMRYHDDAATKDFYRYFTKTNKQQFLSGNVQGLESVFNDQYTNGLTYNWPINRGIDRNDTSSNQFKHPLYFVKGDTVTIKLCRIDQAVYDFWLTADAAYGNTGNPFASPSNLQSNVTGALGTWTGYASNHSPNYQQIIIPK